MMLYKEFYSETVYNKKYNIINLMYFSITLLLIVTTCITVCNYKHSIFIYIAVIGRRSVEYAALAVPQKKKKNAL